jgi:hypothetical protein
VAASSATQGTNAATGAGANRAAIPRRSRIELVADTVEAPYDDPAAHIVVRRSGNLQSSASFTWWTESGTAKPGKDFSPVLPRQEEFPAGKSTMNLFVPIAADKKRREPKSFYIVISDPSPDSTLGRTLAMVTLPPPDGAP